jgi:hypothetical protein
VSTSPATTRPLGIARSRVRNERIAERYARGELIAEIAAAEGVCVKTVTNVARRHGLPRRRPDRRLRDERIAMRYAGGEKTATIAAAVEHAEPHPFGDGSGGPGRQFATAGGLSTVALYGSNAALAAQILLDASPVSMRRKRLVLEEIAKYRPTGRRQSAP